MAATIDAPAHLAAALWVERATSPDGCPTLRQVRHPSCLVEVVLQAEQGTEDLPCLAAAAREATPSYLEVLAGLLPEFEEVLLAVVGALSQDNHNFGWLPVGWGLQDDLPDDVNPVRSFVVPRGSPQDCTDATLVLLAARRLNGKAVGDGVGLRVTAHASRRAAGEAWRLRFASLNASRLELATTPLPGYLSDSCESSRSKALRSLLERALPVGSAASQEVRHVAVHALEMDGETDWICRVHGVAIRKPLDSTRRSLVLGYAALVDLRDSVVLACTATPLSSRAEELHLFERDPASAGLPDTLDQRRPSRPARTLDELREFRFAILDNYRAVRPILLRDPGQDEQCRFEVTHERHRGPVRPDSATIGDVSSKIAALPPSVQTQPDPAAKLPLRSDDLAAAQAYLRAKELFDRLSAYGFQAAHYFRHADLPLELRPRARMTGASDGRTVNAEVRPFYRQSTPEVDLLSSATYSKYQRGQRPRLLVRLGSADPRVHRGDQALGLAADPRWTWHEFGHVLGFAATGELELPFAHSVGDALAAITADPDSGLADDGAMRGYTFPWAFAPRRHDRQARLGHCWCGQRVRLGQRDAKMNHHRHGYFEEQLLSSSLFRLYLSLGGDTRRPAVSAAADAVDLDPDLAVRRSASDYVVYLIMTALALLGPNGVVPAQGVDQFVGALIDADIGTTAWEITPPWPYREPPRGVVRRSGGRVHKVVRWAFEQQGLYATDQPGAAAEGLGLPPPGDVYIADQRPGPAGGYAPVPLRWDDVGRAVWQAHPKAVTWREDGFLEVRAGALGEGPAPAATLRVWTRSGFGKGTAWAKADVASRGDLFFECDLRSVRPAGLWVLAAVDAAADRSNLPVGDEPSVAKRWDDVADLMELVAHDNNLALAWVCRQAA